MNQHICSSLKFLVNGRNEGSESMQSKQLQYYNMLVLSYAAKECHMTIETKQINYFERKVGTIGPIEQRKNYDEVVIKLSGKYEFVVIQDNLTSMEENGSLIVS